MRHVHIACWITKGYKHKIRICNIYCSSTATAVKRMRLNVTLYVNCLSCMWLGERNLMPFKVYECYNSHFNYIWLLFMS